MAIRGPPVLPSNYPEHPSGLSQSQSSSRQPLTDSAGNSQVQILAPGNPYYDNKEYHRSERPMYTIPTVLPSVPSQQSVNHSWEQRRQRNRRMRTQKYSRNPISESPHYLAYRARQNRDGNPDDAKWPELLEDAFLDALLLIPHMGRRKFSYRGKPHGRNELIKEYIWLSYLQSLAPGQQPDPAMLRTRKQVSSHIQVLKTFFKDHPAYQTLFPQQKGPKNGFEDSFKNDPCLRALSEGRLPDRVPRGHFGDYNQMQGIENQSQQGPMMPTLFWLLITSTSIPTDTNGRSTSEEDLCQAGIVAHKYTSLSSQRSRDSIDAISNWRHRFPQLYNIHSQSSLTCDIIHMDVALSLMSSHPPEGAELVSRTELSIPNTGNGHHDMYSNSPTWQIITTLTKPHELCRDPAVDPPVEGQLSTIPVLSVSAQETRIKVPFPAMAWAHAFTSLTDISQNPPSSTNISARALLNEISMFQEVQSSLGSGRPFQRRAIILWTFRKTRDGESSCTNWRYLDTAATGRRECMSPTPGQSQRLNASMNENFNSNFMETSLCGSQANSMDPYSQNHNHHNDLVTPPATVGLHSPFEGHGQQHPVYAMSAIVMGGGHFDIPSENLSFSSATTVDSESTLVDSEVANLESFIANSNALGGFEQHHNDGGWSLENGVGAHVNVAENFDGHDAAWAFAHLQNTPHNDSQHLGGWEDLGVASTQKSETQGWVVEEVAQVNDAVDSHEWAVGGVVSTQKGENQGWVVEEARQVNDTVDGHEWTEGSIEDRVK